MHIIIQIGLAVLALIVVIAIVRKLLKIALYGAIFLAVAAGVMWLMFTGDDRKKDLAEEAQDVAGQAAESGKAALRENAEKARGVAGEALEEAAAASAEAKQTVGEVIDQAAAAASDAKIAAEQTIDGATAAALEDKIRSGVTPLGSPLLNATLAT